MAEQFGLGFGACEAVPAYDAVVKKEPFAVINMRFATREALEDYNRRVPYASKARVNETAGAAEEAYKPVDEKSVSLGLGEPWEKEWQDMPAFEQHDVEPYAYVEQVLDSEEQLEDFAHRLEQSSITVTTKSAWHPERGDGLHMQSDKCWINACDCEPGFCICGKEDNPQYPVYIISKGRWERRLTADSLEEIGVPYHIVVEPQEYDNYAAVIDPAKIIRTPFSNLGKGGIPARNFVWEHALASGAKRHWIL